MPSPHQWTIHTHPGIVPPTARLVPTLLPAPLSSENSPLDTNWSPDTWSPHDRFLHQSLTPNQGSPNHGRAPGSPALTSQESQPRAPDQRSPPNRVAAPISGSPEPTAMPKIPLAAFWEHYHSLFTPAITCSRYHLREFSAAGLRLLDAQASLLDGRPASAFEPNQPPLGRQDGGDSRHLQSPNRGGLDPG